MPNRRGVESVVNFFREHPEWFEVWDLPQEDRIRYRERQTFLEFLETHADQFRPPDIVVIHGPKGTGEPLPQLLRLRFRPTDGHAHPAGRQRRQTAGSPLERGDAQPRR